MSGPKRWAPRVWWNPRSLHTKPDRDPELEKQLLIRAEAVLSGATHMRYETLQALRAYIKAVFPIGS